MLKFGLLTITSCSFWNIFFLPGGAWSKRLCRPYAYDMKLNMIKFVDYNKLDYIYYEIL